MDQTLELVWQQDATAILFVRDADGALSAGDLTLGKPGIGKLALAGDGFPARRLDVQQLIHLADAPPAEPAAGGTARAIFALVELAQRSVAEGLVHPDLDHGGGWWHAFWGATLDQSVQATLTEIAAVLPAVSADAFDGDREATVHDLYPVLVDQIARDRLRADGVQLASAAKQVRPTALDQFLEGLTSADAVLPRHAGVLRSRPEAVRVGRPGARARTSTRWRIGLHLDEREGDALVLELWLQAEDDPTLGLPASLLWSGDDDIFAFLRDGDPRRDLIRQLTELDPVLAEIGIESTRPSRMRRHSIRRPSACSSVTACRCSRSEASRSCCRPPGSARAARVKVNLTASSQPARRASGFLSPTELAQVRLAARSRRRRPHRRRARRACAAKEPFIRVAGKWHALRRSDVERALRFLDRRRAGAGIVDLVRAVSGLETDEAGVELGDVTLDAPLASLLEDGEQRFRSRPTPAAMQFELFPFQERGHGWLRMLGDLGVGAILADDMGLGKTVQAIAMIASEREDFGRDALGPTLVVCPMSVVKQWGAEIARFAPSLRVHLHHGTGGSPVRSSPRAAHNHDVVVTSYDIATRDIDTLALVTWDRLLLDEAQDVKNPATKRARALRGCPRAGRSR